MQIEVHRCEPHNLGHNVDTGKLVLERGIDRPIARPGMPFHVLPSREQEARGAAGWVVDGLFRFGIDDPDHGLDHRARREILSGARFHVLGVAGEQALIDLALDVHRQTEPGFAVDEAHQPP